MRLLRAFFYLAVFAVLVWFSATVPLGKRTLLGHLRAIASTPEARDLASGAKEEAEHVAERVRRELRGDAGARRDAEDRRSPGRRGHER